MGRKPLAAALGVIALGIFACIGFGAWLKSQDSATRRIWQHEQAADADPNTGTDTLPEDFMVDESFETHLPLAIIDTGGEEIVNYKYYDKDTDAMVYPDGVDVYTPMTLSIIDNGNHVNRPADAPAVRTSGKLKVRGNHSALLSKLQYRIKLLDGEGQKQDLSILGMEPSNDWILNGTQSDRSYLRTYLAMNLMGSLQACTPDVRYCELLMKTGDKYQYQGIYMFLEPVARGVGRVEISKYDPKDLRNSYILRRDRYDKSGTMLNTYLDHIPGKREQWTVERENDALLAVVYPKEDVITPETTGQIEEEINRFEEILYSTDLSTFIQYRQYIDMDSFCDYFLVNEFLASYDAGIHSTYIYKEVGGKLVMGPVWDFDGGMDNVDSMLTRADYIVMGNRPWFEQMVKDPVFAERLNTRYRQLRSGILSEANVEEKIDSAVAYLGKAVGRDTMRWQKEYEGQLLPVVEEETGLMIARNDGTYEKEVRRLKDFLSLHGRFMDENLEFVRQDWGEEAAPFVLPAILILGSFFVAPVLVLKMRKM